MAIAAKFIQQPGKTHQTDGDDEVRELTGSQILCEALIREGVELLYGYPGGTIMPFYDALTSYSALHHVLVRHEQGAAHAADGYARATGKVGVCVATSGPGATNLVTGLATAFMDSTPVVAITGQVARPLIGRDAFQETDVLGVTQPITKHNFLVRNTDELADVIHEAFRIARSGRPGPVLIDIPKDVQLLKAKYRASAHVTSDKYLEMLKTNTEQPSDYLLSQAAQLVSHAQRPVIMAGHGVILSNAYTELRAFAEKTSIPVITTLLGLSAFPENHPLFLGMPGMHGPVFVNKAIDAADLIIGVGLRFDDRVTGDVTKFAPNARIIHIDIDPSEMHKVKIATVPIVADAQVALAALTRAVESADRSAWLKEIRSWQDAENRRTIKREDSFPDPTGILEAIHKATGGEAIVVSDVGQHQMWTARFYPWTRLNSHITSGGLGTMGFSLPAAMGVKMGMPEATVWVVAGDGGIQMNIQELATLQQEGIAIKVAIMNNGYLGMVRQWQQFFHSRNYSETPITGPDYEKLAAAYGLTGMRITSRDDVESAVQRAMETEGTVIIDFVIEPEANVFPMIPSGKSVADIIEEPVKETSGDD